MDDPVWDATTFTKNRDRLLAGEVAVKFLSTVMAHSRVKRLLSSEHFSVDGTLIEAWSSPKSFQPKDGSGSPPSPGRNERRPLIFCATYAAALARRAVDHELHGCPQEVSGGPPSATAM
jgi:hypothetical protein